MYLYSLCKYSPFVVVIWSRHFQEKQGSWRCWKTESKLRFELAFVNAVKIPVGFPSVGSEIDAFEACVDLGFWEMC